MSVQRRTAVLCDHRGPECDREVVAVGGDTAAAASAKRNGWLREPHGQQHDVCPVCQGTSQPWTRPPAGRKQLIAARSRTMAQHAAEQLDLAPNQWEHLHRPEQLQGRHEVYVALAHGYYETFEWPELRKQLSIIHATGGLVRWSLARS